MSHLSYQVLSSTVSPGAQACLAQILIYFNLLYRSDAGSACKTYLRCLKLSHSMIRLEAVHTQHTVLATSIPSIRINLGVLLQLDDRVDHDNTCTPTRRVENVSSHSVPLYHAARFTFRSALIGLYIDFSISDAIQPFVSHWPSSSSPPPSISVISGAVARG
jgi:hypothetical protein